MKANKKGISLIVLIITIVVIIILAAAIILNLSNTNLIDNANKAVDANDLAEIQSAVTLKYADIYTDYYTGVITDKNELEPASVAAKVAADTGIDVCADTETSMDSKDHFEVNSKFGVTFVPAAE